METLESPTEDSHVSTETVLRTLIVRITAQDESALTELYRLLIGRVYSLALRVVRDAPTAEEVAEETFWQVWRQASRFDPARGTALAWIITVARSRALDAVRARKRAIANTVVLDTTTAILDAERDADGTSMRPDCASDPEVTRRTDPRELLAALQESEALHKCLSRLEPSSRELLDLAFFNGLTHDEIVTRTGLPLGTVKSRIRRALGLLRTWVLPIDIPAESASRARLQVG